MRFRNRRNTCAAASTSPARPPPADAPRFYVVEGPASQSMVSRASAAARSASAISRNPACAWRSEIAPPPSRKTQENKRSED